MSFLIEYYNKNDFNFNDYKPPIYDFSSVLCFILGYLITIRLSTWFMQSRKPFALKRITTLHNLFLFALSLVMFVGVIVNVLETFQYGSWDSIFCGANRNFRSGRLQFWYYVFYLSKPYEFVDTFTMVFKKKELNFLHVWHHCTTFLLVWVTQVQEMNIQWVSISANAFVHIWMYYYYFMTSIGSTVWWKRYLTLLQVFLFFPVLRTNS